MPGLLLSCDRCRGSRGELFQRTSRKPARGGEVERGIRVERESFSSGFSTESEIRMSWRGKLSCEVDVTNTAIVTASLVAVSLNLSYRRETREHFEKFIRQLDNSFTRNINITQRLWKQSNFDR